MADDRAAAGLAAIKAREASVRAAIARGDAAIDTGPFGMAQLGLRPVVADELGRLWMVEGQMLVLLSGPRRAR